jgi:acetyl esterase/lipase
MRRGQRRAVWLSGLALLGAALGAAGVLWLRTRSLAPPTEPDAWVAYGPHPLHFGHLRLPAGGGPHPVAVLVHGGCWRASVDLHSLDALAEALREAGWATWSLEFRRVGNEGGGWPGTFLDVAHGADHLRVLAREYALDLGRVVAVGHSSGGHLALWLAARSRLAPGDALRATAPPLALRGVIGFGAVADLRAFDALPRRACGRGVSALLDGTPAAVPDRLRQGSPAELLPFGVPQLFVTGADDEAVPASHVRDYAVRARRRGDDVAVFVPTAAGHFDVISPASAAWPAVRTRLLEFLGRVSPPPGVPVPDDAPTERSAAFGTKSPIWYAPCA